jgi:hypothetical protein
MDFEKTIIRTDHRLLTDIAAEVTTLFPQAPYDILSNNNPYFRRKIEQMGFQNSRAEEMVFLLNVVTDLMPINEATPLQKLQYELAAK